MSRLIRFLFSILVALSPPTVFATDYYWNNASGGGWTDASNWLPIGVPSSSTDRAFITSAGTYTVLTNAQYVLANNVVIGGPSGTQNLHVNFQAMVISTLDIGPRGIITLLSQPGFLRSWIWARVR